MANELGLELRIAHYPPYCSKYTPRLSIVSFHTSSSRLGEPILARHRLTDKQIHKPIFFQRR
ncbi:MAG: hypothetical protein JXM69_09525 [Anaerolineae bacterium]|nr:hypothetical protein [Anaerolineae bacterium]